MKIKALKSFGSGVAVMAMGETKTVEECEEVKKLIDMKFVQVVEEKSKATTRKAGK